MLLAQTYLEKDSQDIVLSNEVLIKYFINHGIEIDERIISNPFFGYYFFECFGIERCNTIKDIKLVNGEIKVKTRYGEYCIQSNSSKGLTMIHNDKFDDGSNLVSSSKTVIELIPFKKGFMIFNHSENIVGNINTFEDVIDENIEYRMISKSGIVTEKKSMRNRKYDTGENFFNYEFKPISMTLDEYFMFINKFFELEDIFYSYIKRDELSINKIACCTSYGNKKNSMVTRYFNSQDIINIINLEERDFLARKPKGIDLGKAVKSLNDNHIDYIGSRIINNLSKKMNLLFNVKGNIFAKDSDYQLLDKLLSNSKQYTVK